MNEDEWFTEIDYTRHVGFVEDRLSARKTRLLAVAFCRAVLYLHSESRLHRAIETAEEFADGNSTLQELEGYRQQCREIAIRAHEEMVPLAEVNPGEAMKWRLLSELAWAAAYTTTTPVPVESIGQRTTEIAIVEHTGDNGVIRLQFPSTLNFMTAQNIAFRALVWDSVGNPFTPVRFQADWRTSTTTALARGMYRSRDFAAMPILADALQDAGCDNDEVLHHCRHPGNHFRGCWVVDHILELS